MALFHRLSRSKARRLVQAFLEGDALAWDDLAQTTASVHGLSTSRADESISHLRSSVEGLQDQIGKAQAMRDDLIFLTERGSSAADRLEEYVRLSRADITTPAKEAAQLKQKIAQGFDPDLNSVDANDVAKRTNLKTDLKDRIDTEGVSEAEKELLKALRSAS